MWSVKLIMQNLRWEQRFVSYQKAFTKLEQDLLLANTRELTLLEKQGIIHGFEFTFELAWKLLKDYLEYQGFNNILGPRDSIKEAFNLGIIQNGNIWLEALQARNLTSHVYDEEISEKVFIEIKSKYILIFSELFNKFTKIKND